MLYAIRGPSSICPPTQLLLCTCVSPHVTQMPTWDEDDLRVLFVSVGLIGAALVIPVLGVIGLNAGLPLADCCDPVSPHPLSSFLLCIWSCQHVSNTYTEHAVHLSG